MHRTVTILFAALGVLVDAGPVFAQGTRAPEPSRAPTAPAPAVTPGAPVPPGDEIKLDESSALRAAANQSRLSAILANAALLQRQFQDLQTEWTKTLDERRKLIDEAGRKSKVDVREVNDWVYDEAGQRYVRSRKKP
jgi:hypothetical protein